MTHYVLLMIEVCPRLERLAVFILDLLKCIRQPCFAKETFYDKSDSYYCACRPGWSGIVCEMHKSK